MPAGLLEERAAYFTNLNFTRFVADADHFSAQMHGHIALIEGQLADGRAFLLGEAPEWVDVGAWFPLWMLGGHVPSAPRFLDGRPVLERWMARMAAFSTGERTEMTADEAIAVARAAGLPPGDGEPVRVWPAAHPETAVTGALVSADDATIAIRRSDDRAGEVTVHFPRIGYRVEALSRPARV